MSAAKDGGSRRWWALILLCVAQFVDVLDINAVIVALPTIGRELGFSHGDLQWVVTSYVLFFGGFLLFAGRLADLFGRRKMFVVGLALFAASSLLCGHAWSPSRWRACTLRSPQRRGIRPRNAPAASRV